MVLYLFDKNNKCSPKCFILKKLFFLFDKNVCKYQPLLITGLLVESGIVISRYHSTVCSFHCKQYMFFQLPNFTLLLSPYAEGQTLSLPFLQLEMELNQKILEKL